MPNATINIISLGSGKVPEGTLWRIWTCEELDHSGALGCLRDVKQQVQNLTNDFKTRLLREDVSLPRRAPPIGSASTRGLLTLGNVPEIEAKSKDYFEEAA